MKTVVIILSFVAAAYADSACHAKGGTCQEDHLSCSGWYESGLCNGPANRRCCVPPGDDSACTSQGGTCQDDSLSCSGSYQSGLCSGPANRRCCLSSGSPTYCGLVRVVSRSEWGARAPKSRSTMTTPVDFTFIHHTVGNRCYSQSACSAEMRGIQNYHMDSLGWNDIGYSFCIGEDGYAYEARGWGVVGAHTSGYNSVSHAISYLGNFDPVLPNEKALNAGQQLIDCGVSQNYIKSNYRLLGHRDVGSTACPGQQLYNEIRTWPRYG
ncbi:peptidoglycan-recognition protein SC2-like [Ptychodera flava]|uniref:peptidoglycan-recognition protein SC2-like n=1 Tax=Ptychodera flava TaxID=63121 RepID=UPI00396A81DA